MYDEHCSVEEFSAAALPAKHHGVVSEYCASESTDYVDALTGP